MESEGGTQVLFELQPAQFARSVFLESINHRYKGRGPKRVCQVPGVKIR